MSVIYEPTGRAREYSLLACNLFTGCVHGCDYCYAPQTLHFTQEQFITNVSPRPRILEKLREDAPRFYGTDKRVLLCFTCDPYQPEEVEQGVTREALKILRDFNVPFQILTKGGMRAARDFDLYGPCDAFATTLTFANDMDTYQHEPKTALPGDRYRAIEYAKEEGLNTWVSLEPIIDPEQSLSMLEGSVFSVDLFKIGKLNYQPSAIDWRQFGIDAIGLCEKFGVPYYIKDDLAAHLEGVKFTNTDTRIVGRK
jgi:DNA repair photolyase